MIVAFRRHTLLLLLDDCLYAHQPTIPHLTRSSLHRCLARHGISRLPEVEGALKAVEQQQPSTGNFNGGVMKRPGDDAPPPPSSSSGRWATSGPR